VLSCVAGGAIGTSQIIMKTINVYNYKYSQKRKKGGDIHHRYILITYCDGIAWKKGYPHTPDAT
jgi:hypothetical protein